MRVFLAGASGAIGRRMLPLLLQAGHEVIGTTRSVDKARLLESKGIRAVVLDVFDRQAVIEAVRAAQPDVIINQLTDLPQQPDQRLLIASYPKNARVRTEGTRNLLAAARIACVQRMIVQSIAFAYAAGGEPHPETDALNVADPRRAVTVRGAADMERQILGEPAIHAIVLRYGLLYGPGTWRDTAAERPSLHVDAAAQAALLAISQGEPGIYNIADDDGAVLISKARAEIGFDPHFRLDCDIIC